jgi:hypothetical protein
VATGSHPAVAQRFVQTVPFPLVSAVPGGQVHVNPPPLFAQIAAGAQLSDPSEHSSMSVQVTPLPRYPGAQSHRKVPSVFVQTAWASHGLFTHSFTSAQVMPLPL